MEQTFTLPSGLSKTERYAMFLNDYKVFVDSDDGSIATLANTSAALHEAFGFFWVGFYLVKDEEWLSLGPFQGSVACTRIRKGRGVCGTAWQKGISIVVPDVDTFPGHIACSSESRSEIVVPMYNSQGNIVGVLDIDSDKTNDFNEDDRIGLESIVEILMSVITL
ncbi:MAG: GAF domain-containing protein [Bacteroidaceae bacterium]|nr:GAF domain-containing protein [Bacteroidaceae bacterium]